MLWDLVYDFYIQHIFGGYNTLSQHFGTIFDGESGDLLTDVKLSMSIGDGNFYEINIGNYFSLIATIITMVIIVTLCALFIWKIIKLVGGLLR